MSTKIDVPLFEGPRIRMTAFDPEHDAEIESQWTYDSEYLAADDSGMIRPLSPFQIRIKSEEEEKNKELLVLAIRTLAENRLIGKIEVKPVASVNRNAWMKLVIGKPEDRGKGYGTEALGMIVRYGFAELDLYRLTAAVSESDPIAVRLFEKAGFRLEVRRRQAIFHAGRRWDALVLGLLQDDYLGASRARQEAR